ncbi:Hypothetical protein D9617_1g088480 [Elsinoe fawcettii]|nr:Hypothetical protein D9617_1g088480 [Elsinoe fawcettii]
MPVTNIDMSKRASRLDQRKTAAKAKRKADAKLVIPDFTGPIVTIEVGLDKEKFYIQQERLGKVPIHEKIPRRPLVGWVNSDSYNVQSVASAAAERAAAAGYTGKKHRGLKRVKVNNHDGDAGAEGDKNVQINAAAAYASECPTGLDLFPKRGDLVKDKEWSLLVDLYLLAQSLLDEVLPAREDMMTKWRAERKIPLGLANRVFEWTPKNDPLRKMLVDFHIYNERGKEVEAEAEIMEGDTTDFLLLAFREMRLNMIQNQSSKWRRDKQVEVLDPWEADTCRYHDHASPREQSECKRKTL